MKEQDKDMHMARDVGKTDISNRTDGDLKSVIIKILT